MANYRAVFIFPAMIGEGRFEFEAPAERPSALWIPFCAMSAIWA